MRVLAIDPGRATGMALWEGAHQAWATDAHGACGWLYERLERGAKLDLVVIERFNIVGGQGRAREANETIEVIGVVRWLCRCYGVPLKEQQPAEGKAATNWVRRLGWETPGPGDHSFSASRHLAVTLVEYGLVDPAAVLVDAVE